jgi:hypothetical protein
MGVLAKPGRDGVCPSHEEILILKERTEATEATEGTEECAGVVITFLCA